MLTDSLFVDATCFYTQHKDLVNAEVAGFVPGPPSAILTQWQNNRDGDSWGAELAVEYRPYEALRLRSQIGCMDLDLEAVGTGAQQIVRPRKDSRVNANFSAECTPCDWLSGTVVVRYLSDIETNSPGIDYPAYWDLDPTERQSGGQCDPLAHWA